MFEDDAFVRSAEILWQEVPDADAYPFDIPAIASLDAIRFGKGFTFFCGENGTGKSTLLEAIAIAFGFNPEGGSRNYTFSTKPTHSPLHDFIRLDRSLYRPLDGYFVRSDTLFNLISATDELEDDRRYYGGTSLHARSHGEGIMTLITRRFGPQGFYLLDEPETGLSQSGQIALACELARLRDAGCQLIVATHSPILLSLPDAAVYQFEDEVRAIDARESFEWIMMRRFMDDPEAAMRPFLEP